MIEACPQSLNLAHWVGRPPSDPCWGHVESCPDCRAALQAYEAFLNPASSAPDFDLDVADRELARRLDLEIAPSNLPPDRLPTPRSGWYRPELWYGLAAVLVVGFGVMFANDVSRLTGRTAPVEAGRLRGDRGVDPLFTCRLVQDELVLTWPDCPPCDEARIVLFDEAMAELTRISVRDGFEATIADPDLVHRTRYCQVSLMMEGDTFQRGPIQAPQPEGP